MKNKDLLHINAAYIWGLAVFILATAIPLHASTRAALLIGAFTPLVILHIKISVGKASWRTMQPFFVLSALWAIKYCLFCINEMIHLFTNGFSMLIEWIDIFLFFVILLIISVSFILKKPFFYEKAKQGSVVFIIGIVLLITSVFYIVIAGTMLLSVHHYFGLSLSKPLW